MASGWDLQSIELALGNIVNMDYFPVTIEQMPIVNGKKLSPLEFLEHVRKNLNDFIAFYTGVKFHTMEEKLPNDPRFKGETKLWESDNPYSALLSITIPINDGSVICSDYYDYFNYYVNKHPNWKFTTIKGTVDGDHPVSGNREFGCFENDNGSYTFYRVQSHPDLKDPFGWLSSAAFLGSDMLWSSFQRGVEDFVNSHKGKAQAQASKSKT